MTFPTLGLAVAPPADPLLARVLRVVNRWCVVRYAEIGDSVDAWMVTDTSDPELVTTNVPVLVWTRDPASTRAELWSELGWLVGPKPSDARLRSPALVIPDPSIDATAVPYVAPLVRRRWRTRLGLPDVMIVGVGMDSDRQIPEALRPTALAVASVGVAVGDEVLTSMAWGAPTMTDYKTARRLGLGDAVAMVDDSRHFVEAARELSQNRTEMSVLSWAGRRTVEERYDLASAAYCVAQAAGLFDAQDPSHGVLSGLSDICASPATARSIVRRITS